jgi:hypothetical protein
MSISFFLKIHIHNVQHDGSTGGESGDVYGIDDLS